MKKCSKKLRAFALSALFLTAIGCESLPSGLIWKNEDADRTHAKRQSEKGEEVSPARLETRPVSPITPEDAQRTALSRPKVVKVQEVGNRSGANKSYYDVVDERSQATLAPVIDESARPTRIVTYDNNAIQKDYPMRFGVVWGRIIESLLEMPLDTVDRSSGIITTGWIYDQRANAGDLLSLNPFNLAQTKVRYRYTVRVLDRGDMTQIRVVPFAEVVTGTRWDYAKPSLIITNRMFERLEQELAVPLPSER